MDYADTLPPQRRFGQTTRPDAWWVQPLLVFLGFSAFIIYSTWAAFQCRRYHGSCTYWFDGNGADYLSPFYSPEIFGISPHAIFGTAPAWWPAWLPFSPAFLILWAPAGFRFTCYYYRGAYYKAFWADPLNCAVGEPRKSLSGRTLLPAHHAKHPPLFLVCRGAVHFHSRRTMRGWECGSRTASGMEHFGVGVGTLVLAMNVVLLASYTFGCHSLRHLIGGFLDRTVQKPACAKGYSCVSCLNRRHMLWAWFSLFWVGFTDVYVRLCAMGIWHDFRFL